MSDWYLTAIPAGLARYRDSHDFIAADPSRKSGMNVKGETGGWDVANGFRLAETTITGVLDSEWRISVLHRTVYGVLRRMSQSPE